MSEMAHYADLLGDIKTRIRRAQVKATLSANAEMILMYWDMGRMILEGRNAKVGEPLSFPGGPAIFGTNSPK